MEIDKHRAAVLLDAKMLSLAWRIRNDITEAGDVEALNTAVIERAKLTDDYLYLAWCVSLVGGKHIVTTIPEKFNRLPPPPKPVVPTVEAKVSGGRLIWQQDYFEQLAALTASTSAEVAKEMVK